MDALVAVTASPLDGAALAALVEAVGAPDAADGAAVTFVGTVRAENAGRQVVRLEYEAYEPLAVRAFQLIIAEAGEKWPGIRLGIQHRIGSLSPGETSVLIAAASAHRAEAFSACRYAIERVKQVAPIWKREFFEGGDVWVEGAVADPGDESARQLAYRRACA